MLPNRISLVFLLLVFLIMGPVHASLAKVAPNAPIFIGEQNIDISACLNGHTVIAWWPAGADLSTNPSQTITISGSPTSFYVDPALFTGYTGTWYSHDAKPDIPVFVVYQPQFNLSIWDVDTNTDITGQSVPMSTNITYRIDTNLYMAFNYTLRPNANPTDTFYTVTLTSPLGASITQILTGNIGNSKTQFLPFDGNPTITSSPYFWKNGQAWDHTAIGADGNSIYPAGTYTFVASQNLNGMSGSYSGAAAVGNVTSGNRTITFVGAAYPTQTTVVPSLTAPTMTTTEVKTVQTPAQATVQQTATVIPKKTTYSPLPEGIAVMSVGIAALILATRRKY